MIDIHNHLLFGVDDGPKTAEESVLMLREAKLQGIDEIILTPHYRHGYFSYPKELIVRNFECLKEYAAEIGIRIHLGTEYHVNSLMVEHFDEERCFTMAKGKYVLAEYGYETEFSFINNTIQNLLMHGYAPIVAHVERYGCMLEDIDKAEMLRETGALLQVNAGAILGNEGRRQKKFCKRMLQSGLVDIVASDSHGTKQRVNQMGECREYLYKKLDTTYVEKLFVRNPKRILEDD